MMVLTFWQVGLFADGAAVRTTGTETFRVAEQYVDDMLTVNTDEICQVSPSCSSRLERTNNHNRASLRDCTMPGMLEAGLRQSTS